MSEYGRRLAIDADFDTALEAVARAIREEGLYVITSFDVREEFLRVADHDFRRYALIVAWSSDLALEALRQTLDVGTILPTTFAVYELPDGEAAVVIKQPLWPFAEHAGWREAEPALASVADRESERIARVLNRLEHRARPGSAVVSAA